MENKITSTEELKRKFYALSREEQFRFYVVLNDFIDHYENLLEKAIEKKDREEIEKFDHIYQILFALNSFYTQEGDNPLQRGLREWWMVQADRMIEEKTTYTLVDKENKK